MTVATPSWARRRGGPQQSPGFRVVAAVVVVALLAVGLVVATVARRDPPPPKGPAELGTNAAASFIAEVTTTDPGARARAIGRWVVARRVPEFVAAYDRTFAARQRAGVGVAAEPRGYRIAEQGPGVMEVLVWSRVSQTGSRTAESWEISGVGVMAVPGGWQVFSYDGTVYGVRPGDRRLEGFTELVPGSSAR